MTTKELFDCLKSKYPGVDVEVSHDIRFRNGVIQDGNTCRVDGVFSCTRTEENGQDGMLERLKEKIPTPEQKRDSALAAFLKAKAEYERLANEAGQIENNLRGTPLAKQGDA